MKQDNPPPLVAVRAFIKNEVGKILILKRASNDAYGGLWCLPGGKVDYGQTAEEAIIREVKEETSLNCRSVQFIFYLDGLPEKPGDKHYLTLFYECQVSGDLLLNGESSEYAWIELDNLAQFKFAFGSGKALIAYRDYR